MSKVTFPALLALTLIWGAVRPLVAQAPPPSMPPCEFTRTSPVPPSSTLEEQFICYKQAGRRVSVPGTGMAYGSANGAGCIISIAHDRLHLASCNGFTDRALTIPFASIRFVYEEEGKDYVTVDLRQ